MTLAELASFCFGTDRDPARIYIFKDEEDVDNFAKGKDVYDILFCVQSDYKCQMYLKPEYANAKVEYFYATDRNTLAALITPLESSKEKTNE